MDSRILIAANMLKVELDKAAQENVESARHAPQHTQPKSIVSVVKDVELTNLDNIFVQADLSRKHNAIGPV